ncbi:MAG: non-canonical purine NTP pyrophosphatase [Flavobacteriales bacterium MED-G15]|nr:MAG: non-canonical purine NTP pyrophosphatase [Flavobacteriales bacterium MED-G15]|tara:strand:- start:578 stop:1156 length:579 start_codon:yes stop_codon:yes gene_type:complete
MELIFATHNQNKVKEINAVLPSNIQLQSLNDLNFMDDIPETAETLEGNALIKARAIYNQFHRNCFADDTGLEVEALEGAPGVYSARYAGKQKKADDNIEKLLRNLKDYDNTNAQFRTVIALIYNQQEYLFEGIVKGEILREKKGSNGFGYDPVFRPENHFQSFAQLSMKQKNKISHRGRAFEKLIDFLNVKI